MIKTNVNDRRDSVRVKRIVTVRHRLHKRGKTEREDIWQLATTQDMSYSGILFTSALPYKTGDIVELNVVMSGVLSLFNGFGRVVRVTESRKGYFQIGAKYVDLQKRHRDAKSLVSANRDQTPAKKSSSKPKSK
jgi:hypothetical protein